MRILAILLATTSLAWAAEPDICRPFATRYTQIVMDHVWLRAYTRCLDSDEVPDSPPDWQSALRTALPDATPLVPPLDQEGTAPASGKPMSAAKPSEAPVGQTVASAPPTPAQVCSRVHRRIVWHGKSWRCST